MSHRAAACRALLALVFAHLAACGDDVATDGSATDGSTSSSGTATTQSQPTTSTTATTGEPTGGMTESTGSGTTGTASEPTTGTSTTAVSATDTSTTGSTDSTDSTSTDSTSTDSGTTTDSTTTDSGTTTDSTTGDPIIKSCLDIDYPVKAPLCGADNAPCVTLDDELVSAKPAFRNDMPALALRGDCGPAVLFSEAVGGYHGFYAERTGPDAWTVEPTPMSIATASLEIDPAADVALALVDDGAFGVTLWRRDGGNWAQESALAGKNHARALQLVRDAQGLYHLGHIDDASNAFYEKYDGSWSKEQVFTQAEIHIRLALDGAAAPHLTGWSSAQGTWELFYRAPAAPPEVVTPLGSNVLERQHTALALVGDAPWALLARKQPDQSHALILAHRTGNGTWDLAVLAAEDLGADQLCNFPPNDEGQQCMYDYVRHHPLALLAGESELRALYLSIRRKGTMVSQCIFVPFPMCFWAPQSDASTSELRVAWPQSQPDEHQVAATDVFTDRATARLDGAGDIHLAFYDYPPEGGDPVVRYLRIGS